MKRARNASMQLRGLARLALAVGVALASLVVLPGLAHAQAIGGTVTDTTGGVLPGVVVEARSPALIEQVRTAVTDGSGQYRIVALEIGTYSITFALPGFSTLVREGVALSTGFTANVDAQMAVGALEETVTVTQASPLIDVQSIEQSERISDEVFQALPTSRTYDAMALLIPAMNTAGGPQTSISSDTSGMSGNSSNRMSIHGSNEEDAEVQVDGMDINRVAFDGAPGGMPHDAAIAEYVYDYSANAAEVETGGVRLNLIPKEGSNTFSGGFYADFSQPGLLANNVDQDLVDRGLVGGMDGGLRQDELWGFAPSLGGPIVRDRLWFFAAYSYKQAGILPPNLYDNTDTSALSYVPDLDNPTVDSQTLYESTLRLTWQATSKDKVQAFYSNNHVLQVPSLTGSQLDPIFIAPEGGSELPIRPNIYQVSWVRPQTNSILFEFGASRMENSIPLLPLDRTTQLAHGTGRESLNARIDLPGVFEVTDLTMSRNMAFFFHGSDVHFSSTNTAFRGSMSYVTGSHNLKFGFHSNQKWQNESYNTQSGHVIEEYGLSHLPWTSYITVFGNPIQARFSARPNETNQLTNLGLYAQEQWTIDRLTVNAGIRFDRFKGFYPDQVTEPMRFSPMSRAFQGMTVSSWKDLQPRLGLVYDLRGDGRTALKASASRYGDRNAIALAGLVNPVANNISMSRLWFDGLDNAVFVGAPPGAFPSCIPSVADPAGSGCIPGDGLVQGDPLNPAANGEILSPNTTELGFASPAIVNFFDEDWAFGWGTKAANWEFSASIEQQLADGVSVDFGYFRRTYTNFSVVDNRAVQTTDWDYYTVTVPDNPQLPDDVRGSTLTLVDLDPAAAAVPDSLTTSADHFGGRGRTWQGVDLNFSVRLDRLLVQAGYATGEETENNCAVWTALPEAQVAEVPSTRAGGPTLSPMEHCASSTGWLNQGSVYSSYSLPYYDLEVAGTFFTRPGSRRLALYQVPVATAAAALERAPSDTTLRLNLLPPGSEYGDRLNQIDFRIGKVLTFGGAGGNLRASLDIHNLFNANAVSRERFGIGQDYLLPIGLQPGRLAKFTFQFNF